MAETHLSFFGVMERRLRLVADWNKRAALREQTLGQVYGLLEQARVSLARSHRLLDKPVRKAGQGPRPPVGLESEGSKP